MEIAQERVKVDLSHTVKVKTIADKFKNTVLTKRT